MTENISTNISDAKCNCECRWSVHLAALHPRKAFVAGGLTFFASIIAFQIGGIVMFAATIAVMLAAISDFMFPTAYILNDSGAECRMLLKRSFIEWRDVRKTYSDADGIKLSPLPSLTRLEPFRGVYVRFGENKDVQLSFIGRMLAEAADA